VKNQIKQSIIWFVIGGIISIGSTPAALAGISREEEKELKDTHKAYRETVIDELTESTGLEEVLRYGSLRNAGLKAAFYQWKASVHDIKQASAWDDPQFSFKAFIDEVETRVGPQKEMYSISQKVPFPGKPYTQGQAAIAVSRQKYAEYEKAKLQYFYELKDAYFEYWFLYKNILVTEKNQDLLEHFEGVAQSKYKSSQASNQDLLKAQVELGKLENDLLTLQDYRAPIMARLNAALNRDVALSIGWPEELDHKVFTINEEQVFEKFHENNPDLEKASQRIEEAKKKVRLARLDYLPDVTVEFDYINVDKGPLNVSDNGDDATALMFKVNVPLWYGKQKSQLDESKSLRESAESGKEQLSNDLSAKIKMIFFKIKNAQRQIQLYRDALVPKAEQSLKSSETAYSSGRVDFLNLIDSERTLLEFQLGYYKAIRDYEQRLAELEMMVGESLRG
jgi:outer membrane protein TolC